MANEYTDQKARDALKTTRTDSPGDLRMRLFAHSFIMEEHARNESDVVGRDVAAALADICHMLRWV